MKIQDSSFNGLKVTVGTKSVTHPRTHALTDAPKAICPINFFKVGGINMAYPDHGVQHRMISVVIFFIFLRILLFALLLLYVT